MATASANREHPVKPFNMRILPCNFDRGDVVIVRSSPENLSSGRVIRDHFWIAVVHRTYYASCRRENKYLKVRWWQTKGYPNCSHPNRQNTQYEFGKADQIEVLSTLCVVRRAPELLFPSDGVLQLAPTEWNVAMKVVARSNEEGADDDEDNDEEGEDLNPLPTIQAAAMSTCISPVCVPTKEKQSRVRRAVSTPAGIVQVRHVQPICGMRGEWCDLATPDTEFDVRDRYGRWYGAMVLDGHVGDSGDSVRFSLRGWDGRVKSEIGLPKSCMGTDIAPAGSRTLTIVSHVKYGGRLLTPFETKALRSGTRVSVMWSIDSPTVWYEAVATKTEKHSRNPDWDAWYQLDFDGFDTGVQYFDLLKLAKSQRLRLADQANCGGSKPQHEDNLPVTVAAPYKLSPDKLAEMCASQELLHQRIAGYWSFYGTHYKGTVISCEGQCFVCQYDDGEELVEDGNDDSVYLLPTSPPARVCGPSAAAEDTNGSVDPLEFVAGFALEYCCACKRDGEIWLPATILAPILHWPGWYRVAFEISPSGTGTALSTGSYNGNNTPTDRTVRPAQGNVVKEVLVRAANEDIAWRRPGAVRQPRNDYSDSSNRGRGLRGLRSSLNTCGFQSHSIARSLISPAPTWGRVAPLDACNAGTATTTGAAENHPTLSDREDFRLHGHGSFLTRRDVNGLNVGLGAGTSQSRIHGAGHGSSTVPRQQLRLPDGTVCRVGHTLKICDSHGNVQPDQCNVPIVKVCKIFKSSAAQENSREDAVEVQWLRRGTETFLRESWSGRSNELFLCSHRHQLPAAMLSSLCVVLFGTRKSVAHQMRKQAAHSNPYVCHLAYDAERAAFVDLDEVLEDGQESVPSDNKRKAAMPEPLVPLTGMDLYCGAGGLTEGLRLAGIQSLHGVESDRDAAAAWQLNNRNSTVWHSTCQDLLERIMNKERGLPQPESLDVISMGPPCQGFTTLGHPNASNDEKNRQELQVGLAFTQHMRPKVVICENVPGLLAAQHVESLRVFISGLVASGYQVHCKLLNAAHYGVPSTRRRLFVVGALQGIRLPRFPAPTHCFGNPSDTDTTAAEKLAADKSAAANAIAGCAGERKRVQLPSAPTVRHALDGLPQLDVQEGHSLREMIWMPSQTTTLASPSAEMQPMVEDKTEASGRGDSDENGVELNTFAQWCRQGASSWVHNHTVALVSDAVSSLATQCPELDQPATTVLTKPSPRWFCRHPTQQERYMSPREAARLQSFPDRLRLWGSQSQQYKQVGNAVPVRLAEALGIEIMRAMRAHVARHVGGASSDKSVARPAQKRKPKRNGTSIAKTAAQLTSAQKRMRGGSASPVVGQSEERTSAAVCVHGSQMLKLQHPDGYDSVSHGNGIRSVETARNKRYTCTSSSDGSVVSSLVPSPPGLSGRSLDLPALPVGQDLLNRRVEVWWGGDEEWYTGTVTDYNEATHYYSIRYDDGHSIITDLSSLDSTPCRVVA